MRYRQRYVDLIVNPEVKDTFVKRCQHSPRDPRISGRAGAIWRWIRRFCIPLEIGAAARPFITHHNALDMDMYLRIATELYLKRLIVGGFEQGVRGRPYLPQRGHGYPPQSRNSPSMELYQAYTDYHGMMDLIEDMYPHVAAEGLRHAMMITYQGAEIDLASRLAAHDHGGGGEEVCRRGL